MSQLIDRRNLEFVLYEVLRADELCQHPKYSMHDRETFDAVIDAAEQLAGECFLNHAAKADEQEPAFEGGSVAIIPEIGEALDAFYAAGFGSMSFKESIGGMGLPWIVAQTCLAIFMSANVSTAAYALLTGAAANLLEAFGTDEQKAWFLEAMLTGRCYGTMCLSEPQAGSSLADIRTRAVATTEGHYLIDGTKMWISGGDHQLSENIVHFVLARVPDGPPGVKGISLFLVPKYLPAGIARAGQLNDVTLVGINHKMGCRGTVNTVLNFGEKGRCVGYLIGEPNMGLRYMFHMMNEARIGVGIGATALGYAGYLASLEYAKERPQGRLPDNNEPSSSPVRIIEHADVKRLLLSQKAYVEGAFALVLYCARLVDRKLTAQSGETAHLDLLLDVLTPIAKSWPSESCLEANKNAIQVLGGYGYSREYPVERLYRDNRLNIIHEGTHGIQAIDLLGRKVTQADGLAFKSLVAEISQTVSNAREFDALTPIADALSARCEVLKETTDTLVGELATGERALALANATLYLDAFGHIVVAWMWLEQAIVAEGQMQTCGAHDQQFYTGKLAACQYFYHYELPRVDAALELLGKLDDTCLNIPIDAF
jgi:alkylation response protein AidB-like acyl-CoA dehydrogenase